MLRAWIEGVAARVPSRCEVCRGWPARPVCADCETRFAAPVSRCVRCASPLGTGAGSQPSACSQCLREPPPFDACLAAVCYSFPWTDLIARFKFRGEPGWAAPLAALMRRAAGVEEALRAAHLVLPLPLGPRRLAERGYNQALELARRLAPDRVDARILVRVRETSPQSDLDLAQRLHNVREAFAVDAARARRLRGASVVVVDDVMTSGASVAAATRALKIAGAARVTAVVLARTAPA